MDFYELQITIAILFAYKFSGCGFIDIQERTGTHIVFDTPADQVLQ
jgi:hypothetical protein